MTEGTGGMAVITQEYGASFFGDEIDCGDGCTYL